MLRLARHCPLAVRVLFRGPVRAFGLTVLLAACIALNAALFAVVDGSLLKPLPFPAADRLVAVGSDLRTAGIRHPGPVSRLELRELQRSNAFESVSARGDGALAADRGIDDGLRSVGVTVGYFEMLGARSALGRTLQLDDRVTGALVPVVLGDALWRARFVGDPAIVGKVIELGGSRCLVVGVAPPRFDIPLGANVWNAVDVNDHASKDFRSLGAIARLRPGAACPTEVLGERLLCEPLRHAFSPSNAWSLFLVLAAATALMAMTWFQVACLELARTLTKIREIGVKLALGATRSALALESLCQGLVMATGAVVLGALALPGLLAGLVRFLPPESSLGQPIAADGRAVLFGGLLALGVVGAFTIIPLHALTRVDSTYLLRGVTPARRLSRVTAPWLIVIAQVALSTVLVYLAMLTVRSATALDHVDFGYSPGDIVVARLPSRQTSESGGGDYERIAEQLVRRPGVEAVAGSSGRPLGGPTTTVSIGRQGERQGLRVRMVCVTPGYFRTLGVPLVGGRDFDAHDARGSNFVLIVNAALARRLGLSQWEDGHRLSLLGFPAALVGMVGETVLTRPDDPDPEVVFVPTAQWAPATYVIARGATGSAGRARLRSEVSALLSQAAQPGSYSVMLLADEARRVTAGYRARMIILLALAGIGIALCSTGVFGAVTYACESLRRSIAIRLALGASPDFGRAHLLRQAGARIVAGLALGVAGGLAAGRVGAAILFGVAPFDVVSVVATVTTVAVACGFAVLPPAIRIGRVQPYEVLREE